MNLLTRPITIVGFLLCLALSTAALAQKQQSWPGEDIVQQANQAFQQGDNQEANMLYQKAIDMGNPMAMNNLAVAYERGRGVAQDPEKAAELYRRAAEAGEPTGMYNMGVNYRYGELGFPQDERVAQQWLKEARKRGNELAKEELSRPVPDPGFGLNRAANRARDKGDPARAVELWRAAAELGNKNAMNHLGNAYYNGVGVMENYTLAMEWYQKAAKAGNSDGHVNTGMLYRYGNGTVVNEAEAIKWFRQGARLGNADGQSSLTSAPRQSAQSEAEQLFNRAGEAAARGDHEQAAALWLQAPSHRPAIYNLGFAYLHGIGVPQDRAKAIDFLRRSTATGQGHPGAAHILRRLADEGDVELMVFVAGLYQHGRGFDQNGWAARELYQLAALAGHADAETTLASLSAIPQDEGAAELARANELFANKTAAFDWFVKAANKGNVRAMNALGDAYVNGDGTQIDYEAARLWFSRSARTGSGYGQQNYAALLALGFGGPQDGESALLWYQLAAEKGNTMAMFGLGKMYAQGMGIPKDEERAVEWFRVCASHESPRCEKAMIARGLMRDKWADRAAEARAAGERRRREIAQNERAYQQNLSRIWGYTMNAGDANFWAASRARRDCLQRVTESIRRQTYGQQSWRYQNSC